MLRTLRGLDWPQIAARASALVFAVCAASCGSQQPRPIAATAQTEVGAIANAAAPAAGADRLVAQVLDDINTYYLEPVSAHRVAIAGAARLGSLDQRLAVSEALGGGAIVLRYDDRTLASYPAPAETDTAGWGTTVETLVGAARRASPQLAALPAETVDKAVVDGMTRSLDRFSRYAPPDLARDQRAARNGWGGIGITVDGANDTFRVTAVEPQSPAERAGIRPEDQIVAIDGVTTHGCVHREVIDRLRGPVGSPISVGIVPSGMTETRELRLKRAPVFEPTVTASRDGDLGVIRVHSFNHRTTARVAESLAALRAQAGGRLAGIVLDLRSNPGGVLD
ncbi:MAG: S41 family peptidase, partial [Alphaproteobacteria bacterium]